MKSKADLVTGWEAAILLGITWDQWRTSQWRRKTGKAVWPEPVVVGETLKYDLFRRQDVLECKLRFWRTHFPKDQYAKQAMPAQKTTKPLKKYKTEEGDYLITESDGTYFRIWWHIAEWGDSGGCLGEVPRKPDPPPTKDEWEGWQADRLVAPLADGHDSTGFYFETLKKARTALRVANDGLHSGEAPWPAWATQAAAAGWEPPKGWKP